MLTPNEHENRLFQVKLQQHGWMKMKIFIRILLWKFLTCYQLYYGNALVNSQASLILLVHNAALTYLLLSMQIKVSLDLAV